MEEIKLPPPERAAKTAIGAGSSGKGTVGSYLKADALFSEKGGRKLDYGSGRGEGAKLIKADTYEPYVKSKPKYNDAKKIPSASYNKVTSLNVLNVLPPEARSEAVKNIGRILTVNGEAVISTRGVKDVESAKNKVKIKDGYIIGKGNDARFQKGFTAQELKNYVQKTLGKGFIVESAKGIGKAAIKIKKLSIPKGLGGVTRQEGTPVINIQEKLLFNPRQNFSSGGDVMENKMLSLSELEMFLKEYGYYHDTDPRNSMNTEGKDLANPEVQKDIAKQLEDRKKLDVISALPISRKAGKRIKEERLEEALEKGKALNVNKGGSMPKQMELFNEGGLKDEGGTVDPVSGNDVPPGSTQEEVRDDIPAQLSEGEFVFPADVVRYIGLEKLMMMRQEAKQGLKQMEAMGQMGNSDEATMPDDLPFDETDLDIEDDLEYNTGGVVQAANGTYVAPTVPIGSQPLGTNPMGNPTQMPQQQVASGVAGSTRGTPYVPNVANVYGSQGTPYAPVSYNQLLGSSASGAPQTKNIRYFNEATGQTRMIPHILNADGTVGDTLYPVPEGFVRQEEAPKEEAKKTQVQTTKVAPVDAGDGGDDGGSPQGSSISLGGTIDYDKTNRLGGPVRGSYLTKGATTFTTSFNIPGFSPLTPGAMIKSGLMGITGEYPKGTTVSMKLGNISKIISIDEYNSLKKNTTGKEAKTFAKGMKDLRDFNRGVVTVEAGEYKNRSTGENYTPDQVVSIGKDIAERIGAKDYDKEFLGFDISADAVDEYNKLSDAEQDAYNDYATEQQEQEEGKRAKDFTFGGKSLAQLEAESRAAVQQQQSDDSPSDDGGVSQETQDTFGDTGEADFDPVAKGSFITKRKASGKIKKKYMKRGGLASR